MYKNGHVDLCIIPCINQLYTAFDLYSALRNICSPLRNIRSPLRNICSALLNISSALRNITQMPVMGKLQQAVRNNNSIILSFLELFDNYLLPDYFGTPMIICVYSDKSFLLFFVNRN